MLNRLAALSLTLSVLLAVNVYAQTGGSQPADDPPEEPALYHYLDPLDGVYRHVEVDRDCLAEAGIWPQGGVDEFRLRFYTQDKLNLLRQELLIVIAQQHCLRDGGGD